MRVLLLVVLVLSLLFALLFAAGGAGMYGSPFHYVPPYHPTQGELDMERVMMSSGKRSPDSTGWTAKMAEGRRAAVVEEILMALTILVGPLACGAALAVHRRSPCLACISLVIGAIAGALLGTATRFVHVWEWVFLITVWLPMALVAVGVGALSRFPKSPSLKSDKDVE